MNSLKAGQQVAVSDASEEQAIRDLVTDEYEYTYVGKLNGKHWSRRGNSDGIYSYRYTVAVPKGTKTAEEIAE